MTGLPVGDIDKVMPLKSDRCNRCGRSLGLQEECLCDENGVRTGTKCLVCRGWHELGHCPHKLKSLRKVSPCPCCPDGEQLAQLIAQNMCVVFDWREEKCPVMVKSILSSMTEYENHGNRNTW